MKRRYREASIMPPIDFSILNLIPTGLSAVSAGFLAVRITKGHWTRYPHFLAAAITGAAITILLAYPSRPDDIVGGVLMLMTGVVGGCIGVFAAGRFLGRPASED